MKKIQNAFTATGIAITVLMCAAGSVPTVASAATGHRQFFNANVQLDAGPTMVIDLRHADPCAVVADQIVRTGEYAGSSETLRCVGEEDSDTVTLLMGMYRLNH